MMNEVVRITVNNSIATVIMEDRESKNTFSEDFLYSLKRVFSIIKHDETIKVVIIHGYDNYFCCGGTQTELIKIYDGKNTFTDLGIHDILLRCDVPVIAAMQGHALGGGLVFGCYADVIVMAKQAMYSTNFMKYGFTPGFGSTYIIPHRFGDVLGREMLFSAKNYSGAELLERGAGAKVVDRQMVLSVAREIAEELVEKPRLSLMVLKNHFRNLMNNDLTSHISQELAMHELTFKQLEVRDRIEKLF